MHTPPARLKKNSEAKNLGGGVQIACYLHTPKMTASCTFSQIVLHIFANRVANFCKSCCKYLQIFANRVANRVAYFCIFLQILQIFANMHQICTRFTKIVQIFARDLQKIATRFAKICNAVCNAICKNMQRDLRKHAKICNAICENVRTYATRKMPNLRKSVQYREKFNWTIC